MAAALLDEAADRAWRAAAAKASIEANGGCLVLVGMLHRAERTNTNRRFYGRALLEREASEYTAQLLLSGTALGELDHPEPDSPFFKQINVDNASHRVLDLWWEGNDLHASVQVLDTRAGRLVRKIYLSGHNVGFASRGWATLVADEQGVVRVADDYLLITFDCVPRPAFERNMEPMTTPCAALRVAELLHSRNCWWLLNVPAAQLRAAPPPPVWPFHGAAVERPDAQHLHSVCTVLGQPMAPVVELMRHDAAFRARARCLLLLHARLRRDSPGAGLGSLPALLLPFVLTLAAHAEAREVVPRAFLAGLEAPQAASWSRPRLCARPAQFPPLGADWNPLLHAVALADADAALLRAANDDPMFYLDDDASDVEPCRCLRLLDGARRSAAALHDSMRTALHGLRLQPATRASAAAGGEAEDLSECLMAEAEDFGSLSDDELAQEQEEGDEEPLLLVLGDSDEEDGGDAGGWHAVNRPWHG